MGILQINPGSNREKQLMPSFESNNECSLAYIFLLRIYEFGGGVYTSRINVVMSLKCAVLRKCMRLWILMCHKLFFHKDWKKKSADYKR